MKNLRALYLRTFLLLVLLLNVFSVDLTRQPQVYLYQDAYAQHVSNPSRVVAKSATSILRKLTRQQKGEIGEENIERALKALGRNMDELFEAERIYMKKGVLNHGLDGLFQGIRRNRYNIIEAKATSSTGKLYEGILNNTKTGRQMETAWIRSSLDNARKNATNILENSTSSAAQRKAAQRYLKTIAEVDKSLTLGKTNRTLVLTRLMGTDTPVGVDRTVSPSLARYFSNIIEVDRHGRVLKGSPYPGLLP